MTIGSFSGMTSVVQMVNKRAVTANVQQKSSLSPTRMMAEQFKKIQKTAPDESKETADSAQDTASVYGVSQTPSQVSEEEQHKVDALMDLLQTGANRAELQMQYETLSTDQLVGLTEQKQRQNAADYYTQATSAAFMQYELEFWSPTLFQSSEKEAELKSLGSLETLGLTGLDAMSASERRDAFIQAMGIVSSRSGKTTRSYVAQSQEALQEMDQKQSRLYSSVVNVFGKRDGTPSEIQAFPEYGVASVEDVLAGRYLLERGQLPPLAESYDVRFFEMQQEFLGGANRQKSSMFSAAV